jgi:hypothetical protein
LGLLKYFLHDGDDPTLNTIMQNTMLPEGISGLIASEASQHGNIISLLVT